MGMPAYPNQETYDITSNWTTLSKQFKTKFPQLTEVDLKLVGGKEGETFSRIEMRLNKTHYEVINLLRKLLLVRR